MLHHMVEGWNGSTVLCKVHKAFTTMVRGLMQGGFIVGYTYTYIYRLVSYLPDRLIFIAFQSAIPSLYAISPHLWLLYCTIFFPFFFRIDLLPITYIHIILRLHYIIKLMLFITVIIYRPNETLIFFFTKILRKKFLRFATLLYKL